MHRPLYMMKSRISLYALLVLFIFALSSIWLFYRLQKPESVPVLPATINHDCAPWDGSAFTVSVPIEEGSIKISIYQAPDINHPITFSFDEASGETGQAIFLPAVGSPEQLAGKVSFQRVEQGTTAEGEYNFQTESGRRFIGKFKAEWGNEVVFCG